MPSKIEDLNKRAAKSYDDGRSWRALWNDLYTYALPNRRPSGTAETKGQTNDMVFDATATRAAFRFAGRVQRDAVPPYQQFVELKIGPAAEAAIASQVSDPDQVKDIVQAVAIEMEKWCALGHATLENSNFALASGETFIDYFGGQGALLMLEDEETICEFVSVPATELGLRENGRGHVCGIYWKRQFRAADIKDEWPEVHLSAEMQNNISQDPEKYWLICQACEYDKRKKTWTFTVYFIERLNDPAIYETTLEICPWLVPRFYKVPGEAYGRGPGLMALPTIKTLNKVTELTLRAVAFAVLGLWMHRNDRVFNPRMARMTPGAMWAVQSTGGPLGPSLARLEVPGRYDISNIVLQDLREGVKQTTFDDTLPPDSGAVRSATEIVERMKRLMADLASVYPRLMREFVVPLWQWLLYVLYKRKLIVTEVRLDQLVTKLTITSPIARAQQAQDVSNIVDWLQIMLATGGPQAMMLTAKIEDVFAVIGAKLGVSPQLIRSTAERKGIMQMVAQIVAQAQMAGQGGAVPMPESGPAQAEQAASGAEIAELRQAA